LGKKFKNSEEAIKALKNQGWIPEKASKHIKFSHPHYEYKLPVPKKHKYLSDEVEHSILKAMKIVEERM
jgi:hypothetical protein